MLDVPHSYRDPFVGRSSTLDVPHTVTETCYLLTLDCLVGRSLMLDVPQTVTDTLYPFTSDPLIGRSSKLDVPYTVTDLLPINISPSHRKELNARCFSNMYRDPLPINIRSCCG